ncbi:hypothetical protein GKZ89_01065 [Bacillus mangrovi]|uniref:Uncharacterized protein n=1 Tax=Metabacillus mangrovi TaxID=1491830 RepID=A0A7X2S1D2_9BACI|nr:hypothetical protein [Metabacillus mangrovi]MTH51979.1 hypothetical protein [Metabacillus mangrovi]
MIQAIIQSALEEKEAIRLLWKEELEKRSSHEFSAYLEHTEENEALFQMLFSYFTDFQPVHSDHLTGLLEQLLNNSWPAVYLNMTMQSFRNAAGRIVTRRMESGAEQVYPVLNEWLDAVVNLNTHLAGLKK